MNKLVTTAIIGTGQGTADLSTGTEVDTLTRQATREQPERTLLLAAGAWALYQQAGYALQSPQISQQTAPAEEKVACSPKVASILANLLQKKHEVLLPEALERLQQAQQRLPHELLPLALEYGSKNKQIQTALLPVLGERGRWLALFSDNWSWATQTNADFRDKPLAEIEALWQEETFSQRVEILRYVRTLHPDTALNWIMSTWKKEKVEARTHFIALLEINLSEKDEEFLERALNDRGEDVRAKANYLLRCIPSSAFNQRMQERADTLLQYANGTLQITPPETFDPAWKRDGITQEGERGAQIAGLLFQVISCVPPSHWETRFAATPTTLINAISSIEQVPEGWLEAAIKGWTIAAGRYHITSWFEPLLAWWSKRTDRNDEEYITLFKCLSQDQAEQHVLSHLLVGTNWMEEIIALPRPWSFSFSKACLETLQQKAAELVKDTSNYNFYYKSSSLMDAITRALLPDCFDIALAEWVFPTDPKESKNWYTRHLVDQVNNLKTLLRLRKRILKEIV